MHSFVVVTEAEESGKGGLAASDGDVVWRQNCSLSGTYGEYHCYSNPVEQDQESGQPGQMAVFLILPAVILSNCAKFLSAEVAGAVTKSIYHPILTCQAVKDPCVCWYQWICNSSPQLQACHTCLLATGVMF